MVVRHRACAVDQTEVDAEETCSELEEVKIEGVCCAETCDVEKQYIPTAERSLNQFFLIQKNNSVSSPSLLFIANMVLV